MHLRPPLISESRLPSLRRALLARLMRLANSNPCRIRWYPLKDKLCYHFGQADGYDVQEIQAECWHCVKGIDHTGNECYSCNNGVHHITRTALQRYVIEGFVFHRPLAKIDSKEEFIELSREAETVILRRITHRYVNPAASREALLWIYLIMCGEGRSWERLWLELRCGPTYNTLSLFHPLLTLATLIQYHSRRAYAYRLKNLLFWYHNRNSDIPF